MPQREKVMANPRIPGIPEAEQQAIYDKLHTYNSTKASFKETGCYLVVLPHDGHPAYSLWIYTPLLERRSILYIGDLATDVYTALRLATSELWYANRRVLLVDYNAKRMATHGDDLMSFGKYRGHYLYEILRIDPGYVNWLACKFTARIPKQERMVRMAQAYMAYYMDRMLKRSHQPQRVSRYLGRKGDKLQGLVLKVWQVHLEDDPYKTRMDGNTALFFVTQKIVAFDREGNRVQLSFASKSPSYVSGQLSSLERSYRPGDLLHIASARIAATYERNGIRYTRLNYVKMEKEV